MKVLCVEYNDSLKDLVCIFFTKKGFKARSVTNSLEALIVLQHWCPSLITTSWDLFPYDGSEFLPLLKEKHPTVPILLITRHELSRKEWMALGTSGYLQKPFLLRALEEEVERILDRPFERKFPVDERQRLYRA